MSVHSTASEANKLGSLGRRKGPRRAAPWLAIPLCLALAGGGYAAWQSTQASAVTTTTSTATLSRGTLSLSVAGSGSVAAAQSRALSFAATGTISEVLVAVGDTVAAGQPLARLDAAELRLALQQAEANLKSAEAQLAAANGQGATPAELAAAEAQLRSAQAQYEQTVSGDTTASELASAQAQLASAQAQLDALLAGATASELASAQSTVEQARLSLQAQSASLASAKAKAESAVTTAANNLRDAQDSYSTLYWQNRQLEKLPGDLPQSNQDAEAAAERAVANAEESLKQAQLSYEQARQDEAIGLKQAQTELASAELALQTLVEGATAAELASARASVAAAQATFDSLSQGATTEERAIAQASVEQAQISLTQLSSPGSTASIASAEASVAQAQVALAQAQQDLADATLVAPFAGVISEVLASVGATADASATISLLDPGSLYVELSLSESDVAEVALGQKVELSFDALPDAIITGTVSAVAPAATVSSNVATYAVRVSFDPGAQPIKVGMTASGNILSEERTDALLVPSRAIQSEGDRSLVQVQRAAGQPATPVEITTGLSSDGQTEILSCVATGTLCLNPGDTVVITSASATASSTAASGAGALGGLAGPGAGGPPPGLGR